MKRTTITLPKNILEELLAVTNAKTKSQAVIMAIEEEIKRKKWQKIKRQAGKLEFVKEAVEIRHEDHRTG